ncbi:hypothetical protein OQA88_12690 [Cercophora sp. LCS_1]
MFKATALASLGLLASTATAETVHGAVVFTRHGDRTTKHYGNQQLTSLGAHQNLQVGSDYRARYISASSSHRIQGISETAYDPAQIYATAPNQPILLSTATSFLQGLYPPLVDLNPTIATSTLGNGTNVTAPLNGYQYVPLSSVPTNSPSTIWLKGDDLCPAYTASAKGYFSSSEYLSTLSTTRAFYQSLHPILQSFYPTPESLSFEDAYDIFDLINVAQIHNSSSIVSDETLFQLRTLADKAEFDQNFNASQPARAIGGATLAGGVLNQLNKTVSSKGKLKFSLLAGSYDTFLAFFGLAGLTEVNQDFEALPAYASTMAFELFSDTAEFPTEEKLNVRFLFRNGTEGALKPWPLFGMGKEELSWKEFVAGMKGVAVTSAEKWCGVCGSEADFCGVYDNEVEVQEKKGMSNAVAGVIGAMVTLGVVAVLAAVGFFVMKKRGKSMSRVKSLDEKTSLDSGSKICDILNDLHIVITLIRQLLIKPSRDCVQWVTSIALFKLGFSRDFDKNPLTVYISVDYESEEGKWPAIVGEIQQLLNRYPHNLHLHLEHNTSGESYPEFHSVNRPMTAEQKAIKTNLGFDPDRKYNKLVGLGDDIRPECCISLGGSASADQLRVPGVGTLGCWIEIKTTGQPQWTKYALTNYHVVRPAFDGFQVRTNDKNETIPATPVKDSDLWEVDLKGVGPDFNSKKADIEHPGEYPQR